MIWSGKTAENLALAVCIVQLFAWGFVVGRKAYHALGSAVLAGLADGLLGIALDVARDHRRAPTSGGLTVLSIEPLGSGGRAGERGIA